MDRDNVMANPYIKASTVYDGEVMYIEPTEDIELGQELLIKHTRHKVGSKRGKPIVEIDSVGNNNYIIEGEVKHSIFYNGGDIIKVDADLGVYHQSIDDIGEKEHISTHVGTLKDIQSGI
jgi:hypothetical protein